MNGVGDLNQKALCGSWEVGVGYGYFLEYCKTREPQKISAFQGAWLTLQP